jgi:hypothetical protein
MTNGPVRFAQRPDAAVGAAMRVATGSEDAASGPAARGAEILESVDLEGVSRLMCPAATR